MALEHQGKKVTIWNAVFVYFVKTSLTGIQEGTQCTKCKNNWALKFSIILLYILCALLTITVAILGYKGEYPFLFLPNSKGIWKLIFINKHEKRSYLEVWSTIDPKYPEGISF
jgi:hypothetical protein